MSHYFCSGNVHGKSSLLVEFISVKDGKLDDKDILIFAKKKHTNLSVGVIVDIEKTVDGKFRGFNLVKDASIDTEIMDKYHARSLDAELRHREFLSAQKLVSLREQISGMTVNELRDFSSMSYDRKRAVLLYLLEVFS